MAPEQKLELVHCVYASTVKEEFSLEGIEELLRICRKKNTSLDITGILLFDQGAFFQIIEGAPNDIDHLYEIICRDKRHQKITKIIYEPIEERSFSNWTMGLAKVSMKKLGEIDGLNDFFSQGKSFTDLDEGRAKKLLNAFKEGRWRTSIK